MWGLETTNTLEFTQKNLDLSHNIVKNKDFLQKIYSIKLLPTYMFSSTKV